MIKINEIIQDNLANMNKMNKP